MDALTPLLILTAKKAAEEAEQAKAISTSTRSQIGTYLPAAGATIGTTIGAACLSGFLPAMACAAIGVAAGSWLGVIGPIGAKSEEKKDDAAKETAESPICQATEVDERLVVAVVERVKAELPSLLETLNTTPSQAIVSETYDTVYRSQIAAAQEFLNENRSADLSRVKCLLHKLLPKDYFEYIEQLREHQDPQTIINIMGGQNIVAPNAQSATQSFSSGKSPKKGS